MILFYQKIVGIQYNKNKPKKKPEEKKCFVQGKVVTAKKDVDYIT